MEFIVDAVGKFLGKIFGTANDRLMKRYWLVVKEQINPLEDKMRTLKDEEFPELTAKFKERLKKGDPLDDLMPEAFAACREASRRTTKMRHFDVQLIGGIVLHEGKISEMATGEGKTLVATLPIYLNALTGRGVHLVTVNDYLARRDLQWMGPIYKFLGVTGATLNHDFSYMYDPEVNPGPIGGMNCLRPVDKIDAYAADITYGTNNEFGFDYLRDNMRVRKQDQCQRDHYFAIVDEVDSILIDEARTPLIISGAATETKNDYYLKADQCARFLRKDEDFTVKEKEHQVILTDKGIERAQKFLGVDNFYGGENMDWPHYIESGLKAHNLYKIDREYLIKDGEIIIVDEFTGRMMPGRRWSDGLHEAIEVKEGVKLKKESQTLATITLQNYFRLYEKLGGMTGTAATEAGEFDKIYKLDVAVIPPNKPMRRQNMPDVVFGTEPEKYDAIADEIEKIHKTGRPILVGTTSIAKSEYLAKLLKIRGVKHEILNAKYHEREAQIIAKAGQRDQVTISTNMAGRGTDILLGEEVPDLGGLHVIGTERHEARRIDNQLRGRAGRQGDAGSSQFFLALDDDVFRKFAPPWFKGLMQKMGLTNGERIESKMVSNAIEKAQKNVENHNFDIRKNLLEYDQIMNLQRTAIYTMRQNVLEGKDLKDQIEEMVEHFVARRLNEILEHKDEEDWNPQAVTDWGASRFGIQVKPDEVRDKAKEQVHELVLERVREAYGKREKEFTAEWMREAERYILLDVIDDKWKDHLYNIDQLRDVIGLRGYAQIDPKLEYKREATGLFGEMMEAIEDDVARHIFLVRPRPAEKEEQEQAKLERRWQPTTFTKDSVQATGGGAVGDNAEDENGQQEEKLKPIVSGPKVGRNDPCTCGSGKKYKKCHGKSA